MMYYYLNPKSHVMLLQVLLMILVIVVISMLYHLSTLNDDLKDDINNIEFSCPECPQCPDFSDGKCPDCNCPTNPECPKCPESNIDCPSVEDIVSGIFPGRNTGITTGGNYFVIDANDSYELLPDFEYYQGQNAFPEDSILDQPLSAGNPNIDFNQLNNSIENLNIDTNSQEPLSRMNMGMGNSRRQDSNQPTESREPTQEELNARNEESSP